MKPLRKSKYYGVVLLLGINSLTGSNQTTVPGKTACFSIRVRINGRGVGSPRAITLRTGRTERTVMLKEGCFKMPAILLTEKVLDVTFIVAKNKVSLSAIPLGFFEGPWDVTLEDKNFDSNVPLPAHANPKEVCAVVFHVGEPETVIAQTRCRTPFPSDAASRAR